MTSSFGESPAEQEDLSTKEFDRPLEKTENSSTPEQKDIKSIINGLLDRAKEFFNRRKETVRQVENNVRDDREGAEEIQEIFAEADEIAEITFKKISEQLGSNEGGWYEKEDGERAYIKFYEDVNQARSEYIASAIYSLAGVNVPRSELVNIDGKDGIASHEILDVSDVTPEEAKSSAGLRDSFIASAFLANWDVMGAHFDNLKKDKDGNTVLVDQGGCLEFRARGGQKLFSDTEVPEIVSMRQAPNSAARVFKDISDDEMRAQVEKFSQSVGEEDIATIVNQAGMEQSKADALIKTLKGRRQFLLKHFELQDPEQQRKGREQWDRSIQKIETSKRTEEYSEALWPRESILADSSHIVDQQIHIINAADLGQYELNFKLSLDSILSARKYIEESANDLSAVVEKGYIKYGAKNPSTLSEALVMKQGNITIKIASAKLDGIQVRAMDGLVQIYITQQEGVDKETLFNEIDGLLKSWGISEGLTPPDEKAEQAKMRGDYLTHHKIHNSSVPFEAEQRLKQQEVYPGYKAFIEEGKSVEYKEQSPYAVFHATHGGRLAKILAPEGGLMSSQERYRRGMTYGGASTSEDFDSGGADYVFTRTVTEDGLNNAKEPEQDLGWYNGRNYLILEPDILERTDWFAYDSDRYGSTDPTHFYDRQSPEELFAAQKNNGFEQTNEQMFKVGIPATKIKAIACQPGTKDELIRELMGAGITEINGRSLEECVFEATSRQDFIKASMS